MNFDRVIPFPTPDEAFRQALGAVLEPGYNTAQVDAIAARINRLTRAVGSVQDEKRARLAITQALAAGAFDVDAMRSISEFGPALFRHLIVYRGVGGAAFMRSVKAGQYRAADFLAAMYDPSLAPPPIRTGLPVSKTALCVAAIVVTGLVLGLAAGAGAHFFAP